VPALAPRVRVLYVEQLEIFFPVAPLLRQRRRAKTNFDPPRRAVRAEAACFKSWMYSSPAIERARASRRRGPQESFGLARFQPRFDEVAA